MRLKTFAAPLGFLVALVMVVSACAPAVSPSPTAVPAKPASTAAPAKPAATSNPAKSEATAAEKAAEKPTSAPAAAKPTAVPAAKAAAPPAEKTAADGAVADFYRGKTMKFLVGHAAGGGFDNYSRLIARHIGKYIPGNPTTIVENMPGAGSMIALNHAYSAGPKDGTLIVGPDGGLALQQLFQNPAVEFDMSKVHYLGSPSGFNYIMVVTRQSGITSFEEILGPNATQAILGGVPNTKIDHSALLIKEVLGANVQLVSGYEGTAPIRLAMERGEVHGVITSWESLRSSNIQDMESGNWVILLQLTDEPIQGLPQQDVPLIGEFTETEEQRQLFQYGVIAPNQFSRPYLVAPEVPAERAAALRTAFEQTIRDSDFLAEAAQANLDIGFIPADRLRTQITEFLGMPPNVRDRLKPILMPGS